MSKHRLNVSGTGGGPFTPLELTILERKWYDSFASIHGSIGNTDVSERGLPDWALNMPARNQTPQKNSVSDRVDETPDFHTPNSSASQYFTPSSTTPRTITPKQRDTVFLCSNPNVLRPNGNYSTALPRVPNIRRYRTITH